MAALPKFSFSGWTSQSLAPKVNPATVPPPLPPPGATTSIMTAKGPITATRAAGPGPAPSDYSHLTGTPGQLVAQTNAANTNLPAWLQDEVAKLNAAQALRTQMAGQVTGTPAPAFDPNIGIAAVTNARANYNRQVFGMNQQANLSNMLDQRNQMSAPNAFGFNNPLAIPGQLALDQRIQDFQRFNLPAASGWVGGGRPGSVWANGLLNGTGFA